MLFAITYNWRVSATNTDTKRVRQLFMAWQPPTGVELIAHYYFARGGGLVIMEAAAVPSLFAALSPFSPAVEFEIEPVFNVLEAIAISMDVDDWAEAVMSSRPEQ